MPKVPEKEDITNASVKDVSGDRAKVGKKPAAVSSMKVCCLRETQFKTRLILQSMPTVVENVLSFLIACKI